MLPQDQYLQVGEESRAVQREVLSNNAQARKASSDPTGGLELDGFAELSCLEARASLHLLTSPGFGLPWGKRYELELDALIENNSKRGTR